MNKINLTTDTMALELKAERCELAGKPLNTLVRYLVLNYKLCKEKRGM